MVRIYDNEVLERKIEAIHRKFANRTHPDVNREFREALAEALADAITYDWDADPLNYIEVTPAPDKVVREVNV